MELNDKPQSAADLIRLAIPNVIELTDYCVDCADEFPLSGMEILDEDRFPYDQCDPEGDGVLETVRVCKKCFKKRINR